VCAFVYVRVFVAPRETCEKSQPDVQDYVYVCVVSVCVYVRKRAQHSRASNSKTLRVLLQCVTVRRSVLSCVVMSCSVYIDCNVPSVLQGACVYISTKATTIF